MRTEPVKLRGVITLDEVESTHMLLKSPGHAGVEPYTILSARSQTRGRGQRGNSWESEDGKNLTFSMTARPDWVRPAGQFAISEAVALAMTELLGEYGIGVRVKWPNDIYVADRKICGILIDHSLQGDAITGSVISAGLNVNQLRFLSDAPNPVSMLQLMPPGSQELPLEPMTRRAGELICTKLSETMRPEGRTALHAAFMERLYRNDGRLHSWHDRIKCESIMAAIDGVAPDGTLTLRLPDGTRRSYRFKEVACILPSGTATPS